MTEIEIKNLIQQQLPKLISQDPQIRDFILRTVSDYYAPKQQTESRFDRMLEELKRDREEQTRKWEEQNRKWEEQNRNWDEQKRKSEEYDRKFAEILANMDQDRQENQLRWEEQNRKWEEQNRKWDESGKRFAQMQEQIDQQGRRTDQTLEEIRILNRRYDSTIGALGARWGLYSEASFRNALKGILEDSFGVEVLNINEYDDTGEVFGRPDQVELDLIIKNGLLIICEIKSSMSKSDMYSFDRKVSFYEKRHQHTANRKLIISPMVDERAKPVAQTLGIEVYSYADSVEL
jgi:hypothetical protein